MAAPKNPGGNAGKGRKAGVPNKATKALKDQILGALEAKDGQAWFERQMDENPVAFMGLIRSLLPTEIIGKDGKDLIPPEPDIGKVALVLLGGVHSILKGKSEVS